jgi:hypothetical protein
MKKALLVCLFVLIGISLQVSAQEAKRIMLDAGAGASLGVISGDALPGDSEFSDVEGFLLSLLSLRGGINGTVRYPLASHLSTGVELGVYVMTLEDTDDSYTFVDIPARAILRFGSGKTFIQGFGGYYYSIGNPVFSGFDAGIKASLGGLYFSGSYVIGEISFPRYEIGINLVDLLK